MANKLIQALSSGHYQTLVTFTQSEVAQQTLNRFGVEMYSNYLAAESHFHGGFEFQSIKLVEQANGVIASNIYAKSKNTLMDYRIELAITSTAPHQITRIRLRADTASDKLPHPVNQSQAVKRLNAYIDFLANNQVFSGAVLVAQDNTVLLEKAVGLASKRFGVKNTIDTRFNLGSMNKMFTSVAILQLVEAGKLTLNDKLTTILGITSNSDELNAIELQHLLSHTSGIGALGCKQGDNAITENKPACLAKLAKTDVNFKPGTNYRYSNDGMFLLGLVIEQVTGQDYYDVVKQQVFEAARMHATDNLDLQFPVENAAIGYAFYGQHNQWRNNLFIHEKKGSPAGGGYSTVGDLFKFAQALLSHKLLSQSMTEQAFTPKTKFGTNNYGFGFIDWQRNGKKVVGHNGSFVGVSSQMEMHLDANLTVIVLSNQSFGADPVLAKVHELFGI